MTENVTACNSMPGTQSMMVFTGPQGANRRGEWSWKALGELQGWTTHLDDGQSISGPPAGPP